MSREARCRICTNPIPAKRIGRPAVVCSGECRAENGRRSMLALYRQRQHAKRCGRVPLASRACPDEGPSSLFAWRVPAPRPLPATLLGALVPPPAPRKRGSWNAARADRHLVRGERLTYAEMEAKYRVNAQTLYTRIALAGWEPERACTTPARPMKRRYDVGGGEMLTLKEMAKRSGRQEGTIRTRLGLGWTPSEAMEIDPQSRHSYELPTEPIGLFTVLAEVGHNRHGQRLWRCRCACGREKVVAAFSILRGDSRSCGCVTKQKSAARATARAKTYLIFGERLTLRELEAVSGVPISTLKNRMQRKKVSAHAAAITMGPARAQYQHRGPRRRKGHTSTITRKAA
jgi:hypothetical protein